ncbi:MAG: aminotransferase class III-fold pyridoxal phosphate-dependent enzyme [Thermodesulfobacteriota bacterium]
MSKKSAVFRRDLKADPPKIVRGAGLYIEDDQGRKYLDGNASAGVVGIGHGRTEIAKALYEAGEAVTFVYSGAFTHPWAEGLAEAILSISPKNMAGVYFVSGGSEANESALKLARQYFVERCKAQKYKVMARWQSFHGVTIGTLSLSGRTSWREIYSPYLLPVTHIAPPYCYRCPFGADQASCSLVCADDLERAILLEGPETVAAFFAEPVVGTTVTGLTPPPEYYARIREICDRYDVLFVADEVLSGYGRCGRPFAIQHWKVEPDIMTLGKAIGSGYAPLGAMVVSGKVLEAIRNGSGRFIHGFTYSGTPLSCFVGLKVFEIMSREHLFERGSQIGPVIFDKLKALQERREVIGEVRGLGLLIGVEFVADRNTKRPFPKELGFSALVTEAMRRRNVVVTAGVPRSNFGKDGDHIQISPPFTITETEVNTLIEALDDALTEVTAFARK